MQTMQRVGIDSDWRNYEVFYNHLQLIYLGVVELNLGIIGCYGENI